MLSALMTHQCEDVAFQDISHFWIASPKGSQ